MFPPPPPGGGPHHPFGRRRTPVPASSPAPQPYGPHMVPPTPDVRAPLRATPHAAPHVTTQRGTNLAFAHPGLESQPSTTTPSLDHTTVSHLLAQLGNTQQQLGIFHIPKRLATVHPTLPEHTISPSIHPTPHPAASNIKTLRTY
jgi:hypothetical protein